MLCEIFISFLVSLIIALVRKKSQGFKGGDLRSKYYPSLDFFFTVRRYLLEQGFVLAPAPLRAGGVLRSSVLTLVGGVGVESPDWVKKSLAIFEGKALAPGRASFHFGEMV